MIDWASFLRDVCSADLLANPQQLGGPGHTVAIDETVVARRKPGNPQGRPVPAQWVFGGVDLHTGDFFMELVPRRDAATLLPIILRNVQAGTRIWSDEWGAYNGLNGLDYTYMRRWIIPVISSTRSPAATPITLRAGGLHARQISGGTQMCSDTCYRRTSTSTCGAAGIPTHFRIFLSPSGPNTPSKFGGGRSLRLVYTPQWSMTPADTVQGGPSVRE